MFKLFIILSLLFSSSLLAKAATEIVIQSDQQMRGKSGYSEITMTIIRPDWTRSMDMKSWSKGLDLALVLITAPAKDKGSASLKRKQEMWNWIPSIERVIKIAPSMLGQSWMGSDFTNDDLINQSSIVVDYSHVIMKDDVFENDPTWVIDATAKPNAPVVWSKIRIWISKETYLQRKVEFYDEVNELVNTMTTHNIQLMGGRPLPTLMKMFPADKPGHLTQMLTHEAQFDFEIDDGFFSQSQMKALRD